MLPGRTPGLSIGAAIPVISSSMTAFLKLIHVLLTDVYARPTSAIKHSTIKPPRRKTTVCFEKKVLGLFAWVSSTGLVISVNGDVVSIGSAFTSSILLSWQVLTQLSITLPWLESPEISGILWGWKRYIKSAAL